MGTDQKLKFKKKPVPGNRLKIEILNKINIMKGCAVAGLGFRGFYNYNRPGLFVKYLLNCCYRFRYSHLLKQRWKIAVPSPSLLDKQH